MENDAEVMAAKIQYVLEAPERYAEMCRQARQTYLEKFTVEKMVEGYSKIYEDIVRR